MTHFNYKKFFIIIAVIGLLIFFHIARVLSPVERIVFGLVNPLMQGFYAFSSDLNSKYNKNNNQGNNANESDLLRIKNERLNVENARLKSLEEENNILHQALNFEKTSKNKLILGNIISRGDLLTQKENSELIIDKGSRDGVLPGLAAVGSQGNMIGKVSEVQDNISKIQLVSNEHCKIAASIQNKEKTLGVTEGELGLTIRMNFIPINVKINKGDTVVSSGLEKDIPRGLLIGRISEITAQSTELWQSASIEPISDLNNLIFVSILMP